MSVMLKKKGVFDAMRPADGCCSLLGGPSTSSRPYAWFVETRCGDTQVTLPTVPSSTELTATAVPFPLLPYDSLSEKARDTPSTPAARHQQMAAPVMQS